MYCCYPNLLRNKDSATISSEDTTTDEYEPTRPLSARTGISTVPRKNSAGTKTQQPTTTSPSQQLRSRLHASNQQWGTHLRPLPNLATRTQPRWLWSHLARRSPSPGAQGRIRNQQRIDAPKHTNLAHVQSAKLYPALPPLRWDPTRE